MRGIEQNQGELAAQETIGKKNHTDIDKPLPVDDEKQLIISKMQSKREINPGMDEAVDAEPQDCDSIPLTICKTDQEEKPRVERLGNENQDDGANDFDSSEKANIVKSFVDQNVNPLVLPNSKGHWEGEIGNSKWIPDDDALISWKKGGVEHTKRYADVLEEYKTDGVVYNNKEPDFSVFEDAFIGHVTIDSFSGKRTGNNGTYMMANKAAAELLSKKTGESWSEKQVRDYMNDHGLTWHECSDRRTVRAIPTEINAGFKHTGGIGVQSSVAAAATVMDKRVNLSDGYSLVQDAPFAQIGSDAQEFYAAIESNKRAFQKEKREQRILNKQP